MRFSPFALQLYIWCALILCKLPESFHDLRVYLSFRPEIRIQTSAASIDDDHSVLCSNTGNLHPEVKKVIVRQVKTMLCCTKDAAESC